MSLPWLTILFLLPLLGGLVVAILPNTTEAMIAEQPKTPGGRHEDAAGMDDL